MSLEYHPGQTALLAPVEAAEPVVGHWRREFDETASEGIPAHISVLFPFVDRSEVDDETLAAVTDVAARHPPIEFELAEVRRFEDGSVYLEPRPEQPFRRLTEAVWDRWPDHPPYGGRFETIVPHLTVAIEPPHERAAAIQRSVAAELPLSARAAVIELWTYEPGRWRRLAQFDLAAQPRH